MKKYVAILLGVGFLHRLLYLGTRQLWTDELMQARIIKLASPGEILARLRGGMDLASPLDFFIQRGMTVLLGDSTWALRLHAVIFGTLSIWIFYRISCFLFGKRVALYSATLFTFFPLAYHYSQEARPYALLMCLTLLAYDLLLRQVYGKNQRWQGWMMVAGVLVLLLYTSFLGGLILLSQLTGLSFAAAWKWSLAAPREGDENAAEAREHDPIRWRQVAHYALAALVALALFYPWMRYAWSRPLLAPVSEIMNPKLVLRIIKELGDNSYPVSGLLLIGVFAGIRAMLRHGQRNSLMWLLTWFLVPIPALLLVELWAGYFFAIRHILHAAPPLVLIAGYGLSYVGERMTILPHLPYQLSSPAMVYAGLLVVMSVWIGQVHARSEPADWQGTAAFLGQTVRPGDVVSMPMVYALLEYYSPALAAARSEDLDPGPGSLTSESVKRRIVVCYDKMGADPCGGFRTPAMKDPAWIKRQFTGFTLFLRGK
jgi:uncharacterized membrane protein